MLESQDSLVQTFPFKDIGKQAEYMRMSGHLTCFRQDLHIPTLIQPQTSEAMP